MARLAKLNEQYEHWLAVTFGTLPISTCMGRRVGDLPANVLLLISKGCKGNQVRGCRGRGN